MSPAAPPFSLRLYGLATGVAEPLAPWLLRNRSRRGKEDAARLGERLGRAGRARPPGRLVWLHGASVGESLSLLPLIEALAAAGPDLNILVTSGTRTSAELLAQRLPAGVIHQYAPVDGPRAAHRFIDHWRPDLGVFVESELWPNLLLEARRNGVRLALLSAKLSDATFRRWSRLPRAARVLLGGFDLILAQDDRAAARFEALGAHPAGLADLKFGAAPLSADPVKLEDARRRIGDRPVILAASTHPGEDELVLRPFAALANDKAILVVAPRHPVRGPAIAEAAQALGFRTALQSTGGVADAAQILVADVMGELGLWFRLARLAVIGGGFTAGVGGHNPLEPARLDCPFVSGPHVDNWTSTYAALVEARATRLIAPEQLADTLAAAVAQPEAFADMAACAKAYVDGRDADARGVSARILELLG